MEGRTKYTSGQGDRVLVVTCPVLGASLITHWLGEEMTNQLMVNGELTAILDQMEQGNEMHGVLIGTIVSTDEARPSGLIPIEVDLSDQVVLLTCDELKQASAELDAFKERYPHLANQPRMGEGDDIGSLLLGMLACNEDPMADEDAHVRWWTDYVPLDDNTFNALKVSDDLEMTALLDPDGLKETVMEIYREGEDTELIAAVDADDPEAVLARLKVMRHERAMTPFVLTLPDTAEHRELIQLAWSSTLARVRSDCEATIQDLGRYL